MALEQVPYSALDLKYKLDLEERILKFEPPKEAEWTFELPAYLQQINDVFRIDADGIYDVNWNQNRRFSQNL